MRNTIIAAALLSVAAPAIAAQTGAVNLGLDEVHTLTFRAPIATVYVGNPSIADITMIDARHAFVQGKSYGRTNIVALNHDGVQVFNSGVTVTSAATNGTVVLNRGTQRITLTCAGTSCEPTPMPGDGKSAYEATDGVMTQHENAAIAAAHAAAALAH
jgi:hypothetical protein